MTSVLRPHGLVTAINPHTGETARLSFHPDSPYGDCTVHLDKDRGSGPMVFQHHASAWGITGGDPATVRAMADWAAERSRGPWYSSDAPGAVAFRAWAERVAKLAGELEVAR